MPIHVELDIMLARRKMKSKAWSAAIGITEANLSLLKQSKVKCVRFGTLEATCKVLDCQPGDLLHFVDHQAPPAMTNN
ncbi:MAG: helix-turn-helix transcriptional regulator [Pseudomonadota bacterium]|nr:helix-turn-helix transcriptional regulator [Pseudomonadota bacterium]